MSYKTCLNDTFAEHKELNLKSSYKRQMTNCTRENLQVGSMRSYYKYITQQDYYLSENELN